MNLTEVLKKVVQDVELSTEEKEFLDNYRPDGIPKSRLDAEIAKRKEAESRNQELSGAMEELKGKVESLESRDLSETEKLKKDFEKELIRLRGSIQTLSTERDSARQELDSVKFKQSVSELAGKYNFTDQPYLEYLTAKNAGTEVNERGMDDLATELFYYRSVYEMGARDGTEMPLSQVQAS